jgi:hypothetical protein
LARQLLNGSVALRFGSHAPPRPTARRYRDAEGLVERQLPAGAQILVNSRRQPIARRGVEIARGEPAQYLDRRRTVTLWGAESLGGVSTGPLRTKFLRGRFKLSGISITGELQVAGHAQPRDLGAVQANHEGDCGRARARCSSGAPSHKGAPGARYASH